MPVIFASMLLSRVLAWAGPAPAGGSAARLALEHAMQVQGIKLITVAELTAMTARRSGKVAVFDADNADDRATWGVIPGANLLSSFDNYGVAREMPKDKNARLVFYSVSEH